MGLFMHKDKRPLGVIRRRIWNRNNPEKENPMQAGVEELQEAEELLRKAASKSKCKTCKDMSSEIGDMVSDLRRTILKKK